MNGGYCRDGRGQRASQDRPEGITAGAALFEGNDRLICSAKGPPGRAAAATIARDGSGDVTSPNAHAANESLVDDCPCQFGQIVRATRPAPSCREQLAKRLVLHTDTLIPSNRTSVIVTSRAWFVLPGAPVHLSVI
jgi:hypothetical protein